MDTTGSVHPRATARLTEQEAFRAPCSFGRNRGATFLCDRVTLTPGFREGHWNYRGSGVHINADGQPGRRPSVDNDLNPERVPLPIRQALANAMADALAEEHRTAVAYAVELSGVVLP